MYKLEIKNIYIKQKNFPNNAYQILIRKVH